MSYKLFEEMVNGLFFGILQRGISNAESHKAQWELKETPEERLVHGMM